MPRTDETAAGLLHTPTATANQMAPSMKSGWWPTPDTRGFTNEGSLQLLADNAETREEFCNMSYRAGRKRHDRMWPTPRASEYKDTGPVGSKSHTHMKDRHYLCAGVKDPEKPTGQLNPNWVEWLMGYPVGYTDLNN
jgi:hypothetical protein